MKSTRVIAGRPFTPRPPATPQEIDDNPHHDVLVALGRLAGCLLILLVVLAFVFAVLSLEPVDAVLKRVLS